MLAGVAEKCRHSRLARSTHRTEGVTQLDARVRNRCQATLRCSRPLSPHTNRTH